MGSLRTGKGALKIRSVTDAKLREITQRSAYERASKALRKNPVYTDVIPF